MLAYVLAFVVGLGSFALYMAAFFLPEVHRKNDFIWSGIGLFYALVLWVCAGRITGGVLLGQIASVSLLGWLGWQTLTLRRHVASPDQQTPLPTAEDLKASLSELSSPESRSQLVGQVLRTFAQIKEGVQGAILQRRGDANTSTVKLQRQPTVTPEEAYVPPKLEEFGTAGQEAAERFARVAIPDQEAASDVPSEALEEALEETTATVNEVAEDLAQVVSDSAEQVNEVAEDVAQVVSDSAEQATDAVADAPQKATNFLKGITDSVQSLFKGLTQKKESKSIYVRKQYRDAEPETESTTTLVEAESAIGEPVTAELAEPAIEVVSEEVVPDLAGISPAEATAEEIVEDLLEDISAQEASSSPVDGIEASGEVEPQETEKLVPPHPPSRELVDAAIADAEEKNVPYAPPVAEEEASGETDEE